MPLPLLFCSKQGRANTDTASLLLTMVAQMKEECCRHAIAITQMPLTLDSWCVSAPLRQQLYRLGLTKIIIAGKGNYPFTIKNRKPKASAWKKELALHPSTWGIDVPSCRLSAYHPTLGSVILLFFQKSTTRSYSLMSVSQLSLRGAEIWHIWKQHHQIECFWKTLKSVLHIRAMHLSGHGLYTALLIKGLAYILAIRWRAKLAFSQCSITQIMRHLSRDHDLRDALTEHFHEQYLAA